MEIIYTMLVLVWTIISVIGGLVLYFDKVGEMFVPLRDLNRLKQEVVSKTKRLGRKAFYIRNAFFMVLCLLGVWIAPAAAWLLFTVTVLSAIVDYRILEYGHF